MGVILVGVWGLGVFGVICGVDVVLNVFWIEGWVIEGIFEIVLFFVLMGSIISFVLVVSFVGWWCGEINILFVGLCSFVLMIL